MSGDEKVLARLGEYLLNHRDEIMSEWLEAVKGNPEIKSSRYMGYAELIDHLPTLFEELAKRLKNLHNPGSRLPGLGSLKYRTRGQEKIGYFELDLRTLKRPVKEVVLGPKCVMSVDGARRHLRAGGFKNVPDPEINCAISLNQRGFLAVVPRSNCICAFDAIGVYLIRLVLRLPRAPRLFREGGPTRLKWLVPSPAAGASRSTDQRAGSAASASRAPVLDVTIGCAVIVVWGSGGHMAPVAAPRTPVEPAERAPNRYVPTRLPDMGTAARGTIAQLEGCIRRRTGWPRSPRAKDANSRFTQASRPSSVRCASPASPDARWPQSTPASTETSRP